MQFSEAARIAMIGSYVPRKCGIATFSHDLATAYAKTVHNAALAETDRVQILAMNDRDNEYDYGPEVQVEIRQHRKEDYRNAADLLNTGKIDAVSLQHEYGLFGGPDGEFLLDLLDHLRKPVISTLHTVLAEPTPGQHRVLKHICERSSVVVVMAERAKVILSDVYEVPRQRIRLIHHGVPDVEFGPTEPFKKRFGFAGRPMILTFGLLSPGKGIETVLDALSRVVPDHPALVYVVLGVTHPGVRRESGESYRISLETKAVELGIHRNVAFHNRYVSNADLYEYLQAADLYATPYRAKEQITSGTLAYALACGKAIVSTPYWYALELLADGRGTLVDFDDVEGFAVGIRELLENEDKRETIRREAYNFGRQMIWSNVANEYGTSFADACSAFADTGAADVREEKALMRMSLPEVNLNHLLVLTDGTGMLQHAIYATPDRHHGYSIDDNARALIVAAMTATLFEDDRMLNPLQTYLSFIHHAYNPDVGRFRNFMSFDRTWLETDGSDDAQGRVLWALGYLISHAPNEASLGFAEQTFAQSAGRVVETLRSPRSWALSILGLHYYLRKFPHDGSARGTLADLANRLNCAFRDNMKENWPWFEEIVTYDNARVPQAMLIAGINLENREMIDHGLRALDWLLDEQTAADGHLSIIGSDGWLRKSGQRASFDQQPLEPAALIGACKAAYRASWDTHWLAAMRRCFEWYLGRNDGGLCLVDFKTGGCHDGLKKEGLNRNQGAESVLSWLLSLLIMHEMQTGDVLEATPASRRAVDPG